MQTCLTLALTSLLFKCWWALCCQLATGNAVCVLNESWEWLPNTKMFVKLAAHLFPPWEWEASQQIGPILHRNCQAGSDHASLWFCGPRGSSARSAASQGTLCTPGVAVCPGGPFPDPVNYIYSHALKTGSPCHGVHLGLSHCFWPLWYTGAGGCSCTGSWRVTPWNLSGPPWFSAGLYRNAFHKMIVILCLLIYHFSQIDTP